MSDHLGLSSAGWYLQPDGRERYFNGIEWMDQYRLPLPVQPETVIIPVATRASRAPKARRRGKGGWFTPVLLGIVATRTAYGWLEGDIVNAVIQASLWAGALLIVTAAYTIFTGAPSWLSHQSRPSALLTLTVGLALIAPWVLASGAFPV